MTDNPTPRIVEMAATEIGDATHIYRCVLRGGVCGGGGVLVSPHPPCDT